MAVKADAAPSASILVTPSELVSKKTTIDTSPHSPDDSNGISSDDATEKSVSKCMENRKPVFSDTTFAPLLANNPQEPFAVSIVSPPARDQSDPEKVGTGGSILSGLKITELLSRAIVDELPTVEALSSWSAIPLCFFYDFLKAVLSKKILRVIFKSIAKLAQQESQAVVISLPIRPYTRRFVPIHGNKEKFVRGIPNYGQTCFLNSVLQALASLEPFLSYLDAIVRLREQQLAKQSSACFSRHLLQILKCVNGGNDVRVGPREILGFIAEKNSQFSGRHLQQQDAQELMEALINIVLDDSRSISGHFFLSLEISAGTVGDGNRTIRELDTNASQKNLGQSSCIGFSDVLRRLDLEENQCPSSHKPGEQPTSRHISEHEGKLPESEAAKPQSPFNGWHGSVLRCSKCKYIRPIRNSPFLSIPLVPTAVSHYSTNKQRHQLSTGTPNQSHLPVCSLEQCLSDFTNLERVSGVECPYCTMKEEINELRDEQILLREAVHSIAKRGTENPISHGALRSDLSRVQHRLSFLEMSDPDDVYTTTSPSDDDKLCLAPLRGLPLLRSDALKCLTLTRYPKVLCCHIQRLFVDVTTGKTEKCPQHVQFPHLLDLSSYCAYNQKSETAWAAGSLRDAGFANSGYENPPIYCLKGVIQHIGTAEFGHYVTFRENGDGGWCRISDKTVTQVNFAEVRNCQAYMLFYELTLDNAS